MKWASLKEAQKSGHSFDFWRNDDPKCPHCGLSVHIDGNDRYELYEEGGHDVTCPFCDMKFEVVTEVRFSFSTDEQDMEDGDG